jgi:hypothetical protein
MTYRRARRTSAARSIWANHARSIVLAVVVAALVSVGAGVSLGSTCGTNGDLTLRLAQADAAVIGEASPSGPSDAIIEVEQVLKGSGDPNTLEVWVDDSFGPVPQGRRGFLLSGPQEGPLSVNACDVVDPDGLASASSPSIEPGEAAYLVTAGGPYSLAALDASGNPIGYYTGNGTLTAISLCDGGQRVALGTRSDEPEILILDLQTWEAVANVSVPGASGEVSDLVCRSADGDDFDAIVRQPEIAAWIASSRDLSLSVEPVLESRGGGQIAGDVAYVGTGEYANTITTYSLPSLDVISQQEVPLDVVATGAWAINPSGTTAAVMTTDGMTIVDLVTLSSVAGPPIGQTSDPQLSTPALRWVDDQTLAVVEPAALAIGPQEMGAFSRIGADGTMVDREEIAGLAALAVTDGEVVLLTTNEILVDDGRSSVPLPQDTSLPTALVALERSIEIPPFHAATTGTELDLTVFESTSTTTTSTLAATATSAAPTTIPSEVPDTGGGPSASRTVPTVVLAVIALAAIGAFTFGRRRARRS